MKQALTWAAGGTLFLFAMTALGAATVFLFVQEPRERLRRWLLGFAAGLMTAASVWSLLLPAMDRAAAQGLPPWLPAVAGTGAGALFLWGLDALLPRLRPAPGRSSRETTLLVTAFTLHNIPEGMAVGLSFALAAGGEGFAAAAALALGIGAQNFPEGAAVALPLRQEGMGRSRAFALAALSGAVEPVFGVAAALMAAAAGAVMPWLLAFAAGAMLYVTAEELLPQAQGGGAPAYLTGFLLMMLMDTALG